MVSNKNSSFNEQKTRLFNKLRKEIKDERILSTMMGVPRENFINSNMREKTYDDVALPIGYGQTISQPLMVAIMVSALMVGRSDNVLEIGTGSGYQTAILSRLANSVDSIDRIPELLSSASVKLEDLNCKNVKLLTAEVNLGCERRGPYDAIIVSAAAPKLPNSLLEQLKNGGRLVIPVGSQDSQELMRIIRNVEDYSIHVLTSCKFVPLIGKDAWSLQDLQPEN
jgi:protein-L-isoaspartate(D-aspartate) O-methyltransferase